MFTNKYTYKLPKDFDYQVEYYLRGIDPSLADAYHFCRINYIDIGNAQHSGIPDDTFEMRAIDFAIKGNQAAIRQLSIHKDELFEVLTLALKSKETGLLIREVDISENTSSSNMDKKRSLFGLLVSIFAIIETWIMYRNFSSLSSSNTSGLERLGSTIAATLVRPFMVCAMISAAFSFIAYCARWKWGYLAAGAIMIVGILQLPAIVGIPVKPIVIAILMLLAFIVDSYKQRA